MNDRQKPVAVVAIGGNSLIKDKEHTAVRYQWEAVRETATHIAEMIAQGWTVIVTHGNGPQVGFILRRNELAAHEVHTTPLDLIVADTQGSIGYMLQQALDNEFARRGLYRRAFTIVTQVLVDRDDPAFQNPTKPIGGFLTKEEAERFAAEGWPVVEDAGRGWRRVVASPQPKAILEENAIRAAAEEGWIVIAVGGGGIPVVRNEKGELRGVPAVIDKDRASSLLARSIKADLFLISTGVEKVALHFNTPQQRDLDRVTVSELRRYMAEGHFAPGSMLPKIEAVIEYMEAGGKHAIITNPPNIVRALNGETGTHIVHG
ncbi:carbamate kinase [Ardenticatena maritima]|uniref:Carbamate kinase n=1 Tax=Ardenticatena maritima TaxID=872965 RepID=A0A0M8K784_9CHLR|nr:carbamate kinase [Ardenticatena maritima]KPL87136.1 carbamate kinase [Ardenticatena maritima]GAP61756.1 carbamate kinase [Ardenticatena maritima]